MDGDVRDPWALRAAMRGVQGVFHLAAQQSQDYREVNAEGTFTVLQAARTAGVRRVVYASSSAVYGNRVGPLKREDQVPSSVSPYALSKLDAEHHCQVFARLGLETVVLRYFNIFGPRQSPQSPYADAVPRFVTAALRGESCTIHWDGHQSRDFTYVADAVRATLLAMERRNAVGEVINVGSGQSHTLMHLLMTIGTHVGRPVGLTYAPRRPGEVRDIVADIRKARDLLGYQPRVPLDAGVRLTVEHFRRAMANAPREALPGALARSR